ncbi:MAG: GNAT family N-acetyltransferase [Anaerolineales bacterium]
MIAQRTLAGKRVTLRADAACPNYFDIRANTDNRSLGVVKLSGVTGGRAQLKLNLCDTTARGAGYADEVLRLALHYAFDELHLQQLNATAYDCDRRFIVWLIEHGFLPLIRQRNAVQCDGQTYDAIQLDIVREEWSNE